MGIKKFGKKENRGYVIDLMNQENEKQLRQVVHMKDMAAIVLTCRGHVDNFDKTLKNCNKIIRSFEWTEIPDSI